MNADFRFRLRLTRRRAHVIARQIAAAGVLTALALAFLAAALLQSGAGQESTAQRPTLSKTKSAFAP